MVGARLIEGAQEIEPQVAGQLAIETRSYHGPFSGPAFTGSSDSASVTFFVLPDQLPQGGPVYLSLTEKRFHNSSEVWQALRNDPNLVIAPPYSGVNPGDELTIQGLHGPIHLHVAAVPGPTVLYGIIAAPAALAGIDTAPSGSALLLKARPGADTGALTRQVERSMFAQGVQATSIRELLFQGVDSNLAYTTLYDVLLHMGLLVGVLALAMIGIRAAVERRRAIGILRALGYQPPRVLAGLIAEATFIATMGVLAGIGSGLIFGYVLVAGSVTGSEQGTHFAVSLPRLAVALAIIYGTVVLVTGPLASRAARMPPSEAVPSARDEEDRPLRSLEYGGRRVAEGQRGSRSRNDAHYHQIVIARLQLAQGHGD